MSSDYPVIEGKLNEEATASNASPKNSGDERSAKRLKRTLPEDGKDGYYEDPHVDLKGRTTLADYTKSQQEAEHKPNKARTTLAEYTKDQQEDEAEPKEKYTTPTGYIEKRQVAENGPKKECKICMQDVFASNIGQFGCAHAWCGDCLTEAFKLAIKNESSYPVRCCKKLPSIALDHDSVKALVASEILSALTAKVIEYETKDRTYCHDPKCSTFIPSQDPPHRAGICPSCKKLSCTECKKEYSLLGDCCTSGDTNDEAFELWRKESKAAPCPTCHRVILISRGCDRMRCFCKTDFCYNCSIPWKNCQYPKWNEDRLAERTKVIAERRRELCERRGRPRQARYVNVQEVRQQLIDENGCRHNHWTYMSLPSGGGPTCADCLWDADIYLFQCDDCGRRCCKKCSEDYRIIRPRLKRGQLRYRAPQSRLRAFGSAHFSRKRSRGS